MTDTLFCHEIELKCFWLVIAHNKAATDKNSSHVKNTKSLLANYDRCHSREVQLKLTMTSIAINDRIQTSAAFSQTSE